MRKVLVLGMIVIVMLFAAATQIDAAKDPLSLGTILARLLDMEPRRPIHPSDLPMTITESGSYYLTGDASLSFEYGGVGISVAAQRVVIDMMGFSITCEACDESAGIVSTSRSWLQIENGTLDGFEPAISTQGTLIAHRMTAYGHGEDDGGGGFHGGPQSQVTYSLISGFQDIGIGVGDNSLIAHTRCIASELNAGAGSSVLDTVVDVPKEYDGIVVGEGSTVDRCTISSGTHGTGVVAGDRSVITNTTVSSTFYGIVAGARSTVRDCNVVSTDIGVRVGSASLVIGNSVSRNGIGIEVLGSKTRVDSNHATENGDGYKVSGTGNIIVRNSAAANGDNFNVTAGNDVGPIGTAGSATSPWANIEQ